MATPTDSRSLGLKGVSLTGFENQHPVSGLTPQGNQDFCVWHQVRKPSGAEAVAVRFRAELYADDLMRFLDLKNHAADELAQASGDGTLA